MRPIGSSSTGAVFGLSPYRTAADVAHDLRAERSGGAGWAAELGQLLEPGLRDYYARVVDAEVAAGPPYGATPWPVVEHQASRPDGYYQVGSRQVRTVEIKATGSLDGWGPVDGGETVGPLILAPRGVLPRPDYALQGIHQTEAQHPEGFEIVGADVFVVNWETGERRVYRWDRDRRGARLVQRIGDWYDRHIIGGEPVEITAPAVYVPVKRTPVYGPVTDEARAAVLAYVAARTAANEAEAAQDAAKVAVLAHVGDFDGLADPPEPHPEGSRKRNPPKAQPIVTYHAHESRKVNPERVRALAAERPDLAHVLDCLWVTSTSRALLPKLKE